MLIKALKNYNYIFQRKKFTYKNQLLVSEDLKSSLQSTLPEFQLLCP